MASRSRLFTRSRAHHTTNAIQKINLVIFDIDVKDIMINDPTIELKIFNEEEIDLCFDYITLNIENIHLLLWCLSNFKMIEIH
jgi:hypothetical protein